VEAGEGTSLLKENEVSKRKARRALILAILFTTVFMVGEFVGGLYANSLAIMTDAAHLFADIGSMLLSLFAMWLASHPPTSEMSFGFHRAEILGALASVLIIWALTGVLVYEAVLRIIHPPESVDGKLMFFIALGGLVINILDALILHYGAGGHGHSHGLGGGHGHSHGGEKKKKEKEKNIQGDDSVVDSHDEHNDHGHSHAHSKKKKQKGYKNINVQSAFIHVVGDCVQSLGVMAASGVIWYRPSWKIADPIVTFVFAILVLATTVRLLKQSISVLMEGVPQGISQGDVRQDLVSLPGVIEAHDLHIWSLTVGSPSLSVHLILQPGVDGDSTLLLANQRLRENHGILHTTIQIETSGRKDAPCDSGCKQEDPKKTRVH